MDRRLEMVMLSAVGKTLLVLVTLVCLASMGGAMLFAFPLLVPLHWLAARTSGPFGTGGWALLAGLSTFEASWMLIFGATGAEVPSVVIGAGVGLVTSTVILRLRADLVGRTPSASEPAGA